MDLSDPHSSQALRTPFLLTSTFKQRKSLLWGVVGRERNQQGECLGGGSPIGMHSQFTIPTTHKERTSFLSYRPGN